MRRRSCRRERQGGSGNDDSPAAAPAAGAGGGGFGGGGGGGGRRLQPRRVRQVPAAAVPQLPPHDHDAAADDPADRRPAADEHQELRATRSRGVDPSQPDDRPRHAGAGLERPLLLTAGGRRGARRDDLRANRQAEGRLDARPERRRSSRSSASSSRRSAARRPTSTSRSRSCRRSRARRGSRTSCSSARRTSTLGRHRAEGDPAATSDAQVASAKHVADQISGSLVERLEPLAPASASRSRSSPPRPRSCSPRC